MPTENHLENIQHAQDTYRDLEERLEDIDEEAADTVRYHLEDAEDEFDDTPEEDSTLQHVRELVQSAQGAINRLHVPAPDELKDKLETLEEQVETTEDGVVNDLLNEDENDDVEGYEVTIGGETKILDQQTILPIDLLREFEYDPNQYVLYPPDEDERIPKGAELDLAERNEFDAIPADTAYGSTRMDGVLKGHVGDLRKDYQVDVATGELISFAPGELQLGTNEITDRVTALAIGAPPDSEEIDHSIHCSECDEQTTYTTTVDTERELILVEYSECDNQIEQTVST